MKKIDRIIAALPRNSEHRLNALFILVHLAKGEAVHRYTGWGSGWRSLHDATGVKTAMGVLTDAEVKFDRGNDAPRGGVMGDYIKLPRRMLSAVPVFEGLISQIREDRGY